MANIYNYSCNSCSNGCASNNCGNCSYGTLSYLRNSGSCLRSYGNNCGCNNCGSCNNCSNGCNCGCNNCSSVRNDYPWLVSCGGSSVFYSGKCGCADCGNCSACNGCTNCSGCGGCNTCSGCDNCSCCNNGCCTDNSAAAEFIAVAPQNCCSGGAIAFNGECDTDGCFTSDSYGIRINRDGRYAAIYTFASSACDNATNVLSFALNGREIYASRSFLSPAVQTASRSATGQAVFCAKTGDLLTLNTGVAVNISQNGMSCPLATVLIWRIN